MNTVTVATAAEPHLVTMVSNNNCARGNDTSGNRALTAVVINSYSARAPTLLTNSMTDGGRTNPAGPQVEEDDKTQGGMSGGEERHLNLLNSSSDEHEPLLKTEQPPAESEDLPYLRHHHHQPRAGNVLSGRGPNSNNNNNRLVLGTEVKVQAAEGKPENVRGSEVSQGRGTSASPAPVSSLDNKTLLSGYAPPDRASTPNTQGLDIDLCSQKAPASEPVLLPGYAQNPNDHLLHSAATVPSCKDLDSGPEEPIADPRPLCSQAQVPETTASNVFNTLILDPKASILETLDANASGLEGPARKAPHTNPTASSQGVPLSESEALESQCLRA